MRKFHALITGLILTLFTNTSFAHLPTGDVAGFTASINDSTKMVLFTNTSTIGSEPGERRAIWSFGDGTTASTAPLANTQHQYQLPGVYNICLRLYRRTVTGDTTLSSSFCLTLTIARMCLADFETLPYPAAGTMLTLFKALPWTNGNGRPTRICWRFGDGTPDTCLNYTNSYTGQYIVPHAYTTPGQYQVCMNILYDGGCSAYKCKMVQIGRPDTCAADFERINTGATALSVYLKALPSHNNNRKPSSVCWRFGDGTPDTCISYTDNYTGLYAVNHHYNTGGTYEVCVRITYFGGCVAYKCHNIVVAHPDSCGANFEKIPSTNAIPLLTYFRALPYHNNNKKPSRICWQFGDGRDTCINYAAGYVGSYVVAHHYLQPGTYNVCVTIHYFGDCEAHLCRQETILPVQGCSVNLIPVIPSTISLLRGFIATPHSLAVPPSPVAYLCWRFGDGTPDSCVVADSSHPVASYGARHTYPHAGVYTACVRVVFRNGCVAEDCKEVRIIAGAGNPRLSLSPNPTHGDLNVEFVSIRTEQVQVRIINNMGIPVRTYTRNVVQGLNNWNESVGTLAPGVYNYVVQSPYQFVSQSFVKY